MTIGSTQLYKLFHSGKIPIDISRSISIIIVSPKSRNNIKWSFLFVILQQYKIIIVLSVGNRDLKI